MYETEPLADWEQDLLNGTTTVNIKFTVTPTDDPDAVYLTAGERTRMWTRREALGGEGPYAEAARTYFDAHPPKPVHPLADAKVGEFWEIDRWRNNGDPFVQCMRTADALRNWQRASMVSARQVYVLPKAEADRLVAHKGYTMYSHASTPMNALLELAL